MLSKQATCFNHPEDDRDIIGDVVFMLVPSTNTFDFSEHDTSFHRVVPVFHLMQDFFFKPEFEAISNLLWPLPTPEDIMELTLLLRERTAYVAERQAHAVLLHAWDGVLCAAPKRSDELHAYSDIKVEFQDTLGIQLPESESDLRQLISAFSDFASSTTLSGLSKPHIQLAAEQFTRAQREDAARVMRIRDRYADMMEWYTDVLDDLNYDDYERAGVPNAHDGARLWDALVHEDDARARIDINAVMSESRMEGVIWALRGYSRDVVQCLAVALELHDEEHEGGKRSMDKGVGKRKSKSKGLCEDPGDVVLRPTALFRCTGCGDCPYGWPEINVH